MTDETWVVTLAPDHDAATVRQGLDDAGIAVTATMDVIGVITGTGPAAAAERARAIDGVSDVVQDQPIDIGRPGEPGGPDTW